MMNCHPVSTPAETNVALTDRANNLHAEFEGPYQQVIGCLMYAMVLIRDDVTFAVTRCAQYSSRPRLSHWHGQASSGSCDIYEAHSLMESLSQEHHPHSASPITLMPITVMTLAIGNLELALFFSLQMAQSHGALKNKVVLRIL